jgi:hypothetical protein
VSCEIKVEFNKYHMLKCTPINCTEISFNLKMSSDYNGGISYTFITLINKRDLHLKLYKAKTVGYSNINNQSLLRNGAPDTFSGNRS